MTASVDQPHVVGQGAHSNGWIRVAVIEEHEILRLGLVAALLDDSRLHVSAHELEVLDGDEVDVAVVSGEAARRRLFTCPIVVCSDDPDGPGSVTAGNIVAGVLDRESLTAAQLNATVHAAAAGLMVNPQHVRNAFEVQLEPRARRLLELLANGCSTREIAAHMSYSERTIKKLVHQMQGRLQARTRAEIVAKAIREGLI